MRKVETSVLLIAAMGVVAIEVVALMHGVDGVALGASLAALCAIGGWHTGRRSR